MTLARLRMSAALLGLLAIMLGTLGVHHHVSVEAHGRCEHGAEVHLDRVGEPGDEVPVSAPGGGPLLVDPVWWESEGDHHCDVVAPIVAAQPELHAAQPVVPAEAGAQPARTPHIASAIALYRLAPKTSPPRSLV